MMACTCVNAPSEREVNLDTLLRHVVAKIPQMPYEAGLDLLRTFYVEFARKTQLLTAAFSVDFQKGVRDYPLAVPDGYIRYQVKSVAFGTCCTSVSQAQTWSMCGGARFCIRDGSLVLYQAASRDEVAAAIVTQVIIPDSCASKIPESVATAFGYGIAMGAAASAMQTTGKPWSNPGLGAELDRKYARAVQAGRNLALSDGVASSTQLRRVRWA